MKLIVGLGNPGRAYAANRHNVGFQCLNFLARAHGIPFSQRRGKSRLGSGRVAGEEVVLAKPRTFMNRSGEAVAALVRRFSLPLTDLLVIYDDLDLPLGGIRLRGRGGPGGHKGMESIIAHLGSEDFPRLRVGIGSPTEGEAVGYVLSDFTPDERPVIEEVRKRVAEAVRCFLAEGLEAAMNKYN